MGGAGVGRWRCHVTPILLFGCLFLLAHARKQRDAEVVEVTRKTVYEDWTDRQDWKSRATISNVGGLRAKFDYSPAVYTPVRNEKVFGNFNSGLTKDSFYWGNGNSVLYHKAVSVTISPLIAVEKLPFVRINGTLSVCGENTRPVASVSSFSWKIDQVNNNQARGNLPGKVLASGRLHGRRVGDVGVTDGWPAAVQVDVRWFLTGALRLTVEELDGKTASGTVHVCDSLSYWFSSAEFEPLPDRSTAAGPEPPSDAAAGSPVVQDPVVGSVARKAMASIIDEMGAFDETGVKSKAAVGVAAATAATAKDPILTPAEGTFISNVFHRTKREIIQRAVEKQEKQEGGAASAAFENRQNDQCQCRDVGFPTPMVSAPSYKAMCCQLLAPAAGWASCETASDFCGGHCKACDGCIWPYEGQHCDQLAWVYPGSDCSGQVEGLCVKSDTPQHVFVENDANGWGGGCNDLETSATTPGQSPIAIETYTVDTRDDVLPIEPRYTSGTSNVRVNPWGVVLDMPFSGGIYYGGIYYKLLNCTIHWPGEHFVDEENGSIELQFLHGRYSGSLDPEGKPMMMTTPGEVLPDLVTVAVRVLQERSEDRTNLQLEQLLLNVPQGRGKQFQARVAVDPGSLIPADWEHKYMGYDGTVTQPPCRQYPGSFTRVLVVDDVVKIHTDAMTHLVRSQVTPNQRKVHPLASRVIARPPLPEKLKSQSGLSSLQLLGKGWTYGQGAPAWFMLEDKMLRNGVKTANRRNLLCKYGRHQSPVNIIFPNNLNTEIMKDKRNQLQEMAADSDRAEELEAASQKILEWNGGNDHILNDDEIVMVDSGAQALVTSYEKDAPMQVHNEGKIIQIAYSNNCECSMRGIQAAGRTCYKAKHAFLHLASEHRINDKAEAMELQIVHEGGEGLMHLSLVYTLSDKGCKHIDDLLDCLPDAGKSKDCVIDWNKFLPSNPNYYMYDGSETMPPCRENVRWYVMQELLPVTSAQLDKLYLKLGEKLNNRPVQPKNNRLVMQTAFPFLGQIALPDWNFHYLRRRQGGYEKEE